MTPAHAAPKMINSIASKAMALVAAKTGLEASRLKDYATLAEVGVDSLMSLVIAEQLREQLGIAVSSSLFLEHPTVGNLRVWLLSTIVSWLVLVRMRLGGWAISLLGLFFCLFAFAVSYVWSLSRIVGRISWHK